MPTTAFLMWQLIVSSRLGRTEYQLLLMKISWWDRNVKIRYKCFHCDLWIWLTSIDIPTKWIYFVKKGNELFCTEIWCASEYVTRLDVLFCCCSFVEWLWMLFHLPSVLWHCWLDIRKSSWPAKNWVTRCWHGYLSGARCEWFASGPADALATTSSSCFIKIQIGLTFLVPAYAVCPAKEAVERRLLWMLF